MNLRSVIDGISFSGDELRIVSTSLTIGGRAMSARSEVRILLVAFQNLIILRKQIWNKTRNRLVSSGVHVKMESSVSPGGEKAKM